MARRPCERSADFRNSSSHTSWRTSGGVRRSAGAIITNSGSVRALPRTSPRLTRARSRGNRVFEDMLRQFRTLGNLGIRRGAGPILDTALDISRRDRACSAHSFITRAPPMLQYAELGWSAPRPSLGRCAAVLHRAEVPESRHTGSLRRAFEAESGRPLGRFFDRWIYGSELPRVRSTSEPVGAGFGDSPVRADLGTAFRRSCHSDNRVRRRKDQQDVVVPVTERPCGMDGPDRRQGLPLQGPDQSRSCRDRALRLRVGAGRNIAYPQVSGHERAVLLKRDAKRLEATVALGDRVLDRVGRHPGEHSFPLRVS